MLNDKCLIIIPADPEQEERRHFYKHRQTLQWLQFPNEVKPPSGGLASNLSEKKYLQTSRQAAAQFYKHFSFRKQVCGNDITLQD